MRVIKKPVDSFRRSVEVAGLKAKMVRIPSSKSQFFFAGILMADGVWIPWPDNLNDKEMDLYIDRYGNPPDIFELKSEEPADYLRVVKNET